MFKYRLKGDNDYIFDIQGTILKNRGIKDINKFLNIDKKAEISYKKLKDIDKAVSCLDKHIENKSNILIVVDPDVDGYTSAAIMYQYLKMLDGNIKIKYAIHEDKTHGLQKIELPKETNLIIVPDAGSNDFEIHEKFSRQGVEIIILDHHEVERESEYAIVVNPQLGGYDNFNLSGAGITYKFCQALDDYFWCDYADYFLDLVALGNVADSMSMTELETRYYVERGLREINNDFFRALLRQQEYSTKGKINITTIGFYIAPMINAVIRVGSKKDKLDMFKAFIGEKELVKYKPRGSDEILVSLVDDMARRCTNIKNKQGRMVDKIVEEIESKIEAEKLNENKVILIHNIETMEAGLSGLIANKTASKHKKPTIILSEKNKEGNFKGSARGYDKSELKDFKTITENTGLFEMAKGHLNAFGLEIKEKNIKAAINKFNDLLKDYDFEDVYEVDFKVPAESMSDYIIKEICELENIWGKGIEEPFILVENIPLGEADVLLKGKNQNTILINYKGLNYVIFKQNEDIYNEVKQAKSITVVGKSSINEYKDNKYYQLLIDNFHLNY